MNRKKQEDEVVAPETAEKDFSITSMAELQEKVSDVEIFGNPGEWELVCKASSKSQRWMKSTKRLKVDGGWLYQTETQQGDNLSQALAFVKAQ